MSLQPGEKQLYELSIAGQSTDGAYGISFKKDGKNVSKTFGYFSNGVVLEEHTKVEIKDDTLVFGYK